MGVPCSSDTDCDFDKTMCCAGHPDLTMSVKDVPFGTTKPLFSVNDKVVSAFCNFKPASDGGPGAEFFKNHLVHSIDPLNP